MKTRACLALAGSIWLTVAVVAGLLPSPSLASLAPHARAQSTSELTPMAYLPYVSKEPTSTPTPPPGPVGLRVYDMHGNEQIYQWAVDKYGVNVEQIEGEAYHCVELREHSGPASIDVWVHDADGQPAVGIPVQFHWPGGMQEKLAEADGKAGFAYGPGAYITDPGVGGPHWLIIGDESSCDLVSRLGMLAGTVHDHLDVKYKYGALGE